MGQVIAIFNRHQLGQRQLEWGRHDSQQSYPSDHSHRPRLGVLAIQLHRLNGQDGP